MIADKAVGENTRSLFSALAQRITGAFNRIVGVKIVSPASSESPDRSRSPALSSSMEYFSGSLHTLSTLIRCYGSNPLFVPSPQSAVSLFLTTGMVLFLMSGACVLLALLPIFFRSSFWAWVSCFPTCSWSRLEFLRLLYLQRLNGANPDPLFGSRGESRLRNVCF